MTLGRLRSRRPLQTNDDEITRDVAERLGKLGFTRAGAPEVSIEKKFQMIRVAGLLPVCAVLLWAASQPWKSSDPKDWTSQDADRVLTNSPWAQSVSASFALAEDDPPPPPAIDVPQAGMPSPRNGATDGRWDGGVSRVNRNGTPTLEVTVRWDSALPVRQASERKRGGLPYSPEQLRKDYIVTVIGLVPAGRYGQPQLRTNSSSDGLEDLRNPEEMLEGMMRYSFLFPRGKSSIRPEDAKLDTSTGALHIFFPRTQAIEADDKEVTFQMRFGSLSVVRKFRLKDMMYHGQLEL
jgi:hypothetical protein